MPESVVTEQELRAKYLDWCSARLADRFLALSPDEIYELAERAGHGREDTLVAFRASSMAASWLSQMPAGAHSDISVHEPESFRVLIARVTEVLAETLPTFEQWLEAYREAPDRFEEELLGLWREEL